MDFIGKSILIDAFKTLVEKLLKDLMNSIAYNKLPQERKEKICDTIIAIKEATEATRAFITNQGFQTNTNLTAQWRNCLKSAVTANLNEGLEDYLYYKAEFWGNPQEWLKNPSSMELVPKLRDLDDKCGILLQMLKQN